MGISALNASIHNHAAKRRRRPPTLDISEQHLQATKPARRRSALRKPTGTSVSSPQNSTRSQRELGRTLGSSRSRSARRTKCWPPYIAAHNGEVTAARANAQFSFRSSASYRALNTTSALLPNPDVYRRCSEPARRVRGAVSRGLVLPAALFDAEDVAGA